MRTLGRLLDWWTSRPSLTADEKYHQAMQESDDLLRWIRSDETADIARMVSQDIWANRRNGPYMTTVYEAVEEINSSIKQVRQKS